MRRLAMLSVGLLGALAVAVPPASAEQMSGKKSYVAHMTGDQEVSQKGPAGAKGTANVDIDAGAGQACYELTYEGIGKLTGGHIHKGAKGVEGDPVVNLDPGKNGDRACVAGDKAKLEEIDSNPGGYYVNLHTADYKKGAMRASWNRSAEQAAGTAGSTGKGAAHNRLRSDVHRRTRQNDHVWPGQSGTESAPRGLGENDAASR